MAADAQGRRVMLSAPAHRMTAACLWCETAFEPRVSGGSAQRFCGKDCRQEFHTAARAWAERAVLSGLIPVAAFKVARKQHARCVQGHSRLRGVRSAPKANGAVGANLAAGH